MKDNLKSKIIPEDMKETIDEIMEKQLFNANRYYAESNPNISLLMEMESNKCSSEFLLELKKRWNWHNHFYEDLLEPAYLNLVSDSYMELTPSQIKELTGIYRACFLVDEATLVMSGAIKKHLNKKITSLLSNTSSLVNQDELFMLLTPPVESFYTKYHIDHLSYILLCRTDKPKAFKFKNYLLRKYHAGDETIFVSRFKKFEKYFEYSLEKLYEDIKSYQITASYKVKHFYFTLEHPERKAYRDIIIYDNVDEKLISSNLIGISGFMFRKAILKYLNDSGILSNNGYIYEKSNDEVLDGLEKLLIERKKTMEKNVHPYKQNGPTCAICCMIMALEYYKIIPKANWNYEKKYYRSYKSHYMDGAPFSALAWHFAKNGLTTEIIHSEENLFRNDDGNIPKEVFENAMNEYKSFLNSALNKGAKVTNGALIDAHTLREKLEENNLVILAGQHGEFLHAILLIGYNDNDTFVVCDPLFKSKQTKTFEEINKFMDTPIGRWCVVVGVNTIKKDELADNLENYQLEAQKMLGSHKSSSKANDGLIKIKKWGD